MRRYLPLTLLLLAALSGPAFAASNGAQQARPDLFELARLVQLEGGTAAQTALRPGGLSILAPGLTVLVWLSDADSSALSTGLGSSPLPLRSALRRSYAAEELPAAALRMRPPVLRGP